jgi:hypothetical protein
VPDLTPTRAAVRHEMTAPPPPRRALRVLGERRIASRLQIASIIEAHPEVIMGIEAALFIGWTRSVGGKEAESLELFMQATQWFGKLQSEGKLASVETVIMEPHGGDLNGFMLLKGEVGKLLALMQSEEWKDIVSRSAYLMTGFGINHAIVGDGVTAEVQRWAKNFMKK